MSDTLTRVKNATAEVLQIDAANIADDAKFTEDLGGDSVKAAEWIAALELEFDLDIDPPDAVKIRSIQDAVSHIEKASA